MAWRVSDNNFRLNEILGSASQSLDRGQGMRRRSARNKFVLPACQAGFHELVSTGSSQFATECDFAKVGTAVLITSACGLKDERLPSKASMTRLSAWVIDKAIDEHGQSGPSIAAAIRRTGPSRVSSLTPISLLLTVGSTKTSCTPARRLRR